MAEDAGNPPPGRPPRWVPRERSQEEEARRRRNAAVVWVFLALVGMFAIADGKHPPYRGPVECIRTPPGPLECTPRPG